MRLIRNFTAAIFIILTIFYLTACGNSKNGTAQNINANPATENAANQSTRYAPTQPQSGAEGLTIPEGTPIHVRLDESLSTERNRSGDLFQATLSRPIELSDGEAIPQGAKVTGEVLEARPSGHLKTPAEISIALTSLDVGGNDYPISTSRVSRRGRSHKKHDIKWIAGSAAGGALLGALIGHGKGAAIGALAGGGGGTAAAFATGKQNIYLPSETPLHFILRQPVTITKAG